MTTLDGTSRNYKNKRDNKLKKTIRGFKARLAGVATMTDMMLTGRTLSAEEGVQRGLSQYVVPEGQGFAKGVELAQKIASNAPLSNFAVTQALPRIADLSQPDGLFVESLMAAIAQSARLAGVATMTDMMLTGRTLSAEEGVQRGLSQYVVPEGQGFAKGVELAQKIASNAPLSNFAVTQALPRIADLSQPDGLFVESLMAAIAQGDDAAKQRVRAFLEKRAGKVGKPQ